MWPFNKLKKRPFTHNPEDFQLKIVESWFSKEWIEFSYTANGGKTWGKIHCASEPYLGILEYDWKWEGLTYQLGNGIFDSEKEKFSSYQKILDYEKNEKERYEKGQESVLRQRKIHKEKRLEAFRRANS